MCHTCNSFIVATTSVTRNVNLACSWFSTNSCQSCEADKSIIKRKGSKNCPKIPLSWTRYFFFSCHCRWNDGRIYEPFLNFPTKKLGSVFLPGFHGMLIAHIVKRFFSWASSWSRPGPPNTRSCQKLKKQNHIRVLFCGGRAMRALFLIPGMIQS